MAASSKKVIYAALIGNALISVTKFAAALITGSSAMFSEGLHSVVDTGNQVLLLFGLRQSKKPADSRFPFGHGKEVYFWGFVVAILIFAVGAGFSLYEGIRHLFKPVHVQNPMINYVVLGLATVFEGAAWYFAFREFSKVKGNRGYFEAVRRGKDPSMFIVLFEDSAALLGLFVAFLGVFLGQITGIPYFDGAASVVIGLILAATAAWLAYETKGLLIGESANPEVRQGIREILSGYGEVKHVNEILTLHMGPEFILVTISVDFQNNVTAAGVEGAVNRMDRQIRERYPRVKRVFIEAEALKAPSGQVAAGGSDSVTRDPAAGSGPRLPLLLLLPLLTLSAICGGPAHARGPEPVKFEEISIEQGLSQSIVECIIQDRMGFMWFGTEDGLNRYDGYDFTIIRHDPDDANSLSYNHILSLCEDGDGTLWVGTFHGGLNRYDQTTRSFVLYEHGADEPKSLSHNNINRLLVDSGGVLWVGTDDGLNRYNPATDDFTRYLNDPGDSHGLSHNFIREIYQDRSGILWIGTDGGGLNRFDSRTDAFTCYRHDPGDPTTLSHDTVRAICEDRNGVLWIGTVGGGLNSLDRESGTFTRYRHDPADPSSLSHDQVYAVHEDTEGALWVGTNGGGLNRFDRSTGRFFRYRNNPHDPTSLSYDEIYDIFEDRSGVMWLGTYGGGTNKFVKKRKAFQLHEPDPDDPNSLEGDIVWSIHEDEDGILWIGTHGGGLNRLDRQRDLYTHYRHDPNDPGSLSHDVVRVVYEDRAGIFWIGTNGGGLNRFDRATGRFEAYRHDPEDPESLSHDEIRAIYEDRAGTLWIGTYGGGLNRFDRQSGTFSCFRSRPDDPGSLSNDFVRFIVQDSRDVYWVGTQGGGLNIFDPASETFTHFRADPDDPTGLSNDYIFSIHEDDDGIFWIGTWGGGLDRYDSDKGVFRNFTVKDGLPSNSVYGILEDEWENLWLSTNKGLSCFDTRTETFRNYSVEDGLQSSEFNGGSFLESHSGEMFFGGIEGFNAFHPGQIRENPHVPPVVVTSFLKLNRRVHLEPPVSEARQLTLSHKDYVFSFEFASLDFTAPARNLYAYKMDGLDEEWIPTEARRRFATYTTLDPGHYVFRVRGSNNDGIWNEEGTSIEVIITPPLWKTWWVRTLFAMAVFGLAFFFYTKRLKNERMAAELQAAHLAQMSIMPHGDPELDGFDISGITVPANEVGGDFFDYLWLDDERRRFGVAVGDVSGKAMKAAMIAVLSSGMINSHGAGGGSPAGILTALNRPLFAKTGEKMFVALLFASIDTVAGTVTFTNAGFSQPLKKSGDVVEKLGMDGPRFPLGLVEGTVYLERTVQLESGDVLFCCSDGITEATNRARDFFAQARLEELVARLDTVSLTADQIKKKILHTVLDFTGTAPQNDDMTVVVLKKL